MQDLGTPVCKNTAVPAHQQVRDRLLGLIKAKELSTGDKLPSEPEIAEILGVSRMTANKAILSLVADGWLKREKGRGTYVAPSPQSIQKFSVAIVPDNLAGVLEDYYFGALYWGMQALLSEHGYPLEITRLIDGFSNNVAQGTALLAINPPEKFVPELRVCRDRGVPCIIVGANWQNCGVPTVDSDNMLGPAIAVNHLAELGHKRIIFLGAFPCDSNTQDRIRGFRTAMKSRQLQTEPEDEFITEDFLFTDEEIQGILERIHDGATAVFAAGPRLAMQMLVAAQKYNISVPNRLSIVGYDDPGYLSMAHPALTTVCQPLQDMAKLALRVLLDHQHSDQFAPSMHMLDPHIIVRESTAPAIYLTGTNK